jgi:nucleotide-binding universal stress UspA family protein
MTGRTRRVVVALDASAPSLEAARTAAELARTLGAELAGLFVEDVNVLRLARLPFAQQVPSSGGAARPLESEVLEAELRALAAWAREALAREAGLVQVSWSFEVRRGPLPDEVLAAAGRADVLVVGARGHSARGRPGATARAAAERAGTSVVVHARAARAGRGVLVACDGSPDSERALAAAAALARDELVAVCLAPDAQAAERLAGRLRQVLPGPRATARWAGGAGLADLLATARAAVPELLVVAAGSPLLRDGGFALLVAEAPCPVLLARSAAE